MPTDDKGNISLNNSFCTTVSSVHELIQKIFPNINNNFMSDKWLCERSILSATNDWVNAINNEILNTIKTQEYLIKSSDTLINDDEYAQYPTEFLNSIEISGVPSHELRLKIGIPVILLRNLSAPNLCNGTRLRINNVSPNIITATVLTGSAKDQQVIIPKLPIIPTDFPF